MFQDHVFEKCLACYYFAGVMFALMGMMHEWARPTRRLKGIDWPAYFVDQSTLWPIHAIHDVYLAAKGKFD